MKEIGGVDMPPVHRVYKDKIREYVNIFQYLVIWNDASRIHYWFLFLKLVSVKVFKFNNEIKP